MKHVASRKLHTYWDGLRAGRSAPGRDEIDPVAIRDILASVFVLDVAADSLLRPANATFRLSGTRLDALFGRALRNSTFDRLWSPRSAAPAADALALVMDRRRPVVVVARGGPAGRRSVDLELLLLPLECTGGIGTRVLGALSTETTPDWMGLSPTAPLEILPLLGPSSDRTAHTFGRRAARPFTLLPGGSDASSTTFRS